MDKEKPGYPSGDHEIGPTPAPPGPAPGAQHSDDGLLMKIARVAADNERRVEEIAEQAHVRYHSDAEFHARAYMAAQIAEQGIEASGHRVDRTTRLHVLRAAILGVFVADLDPATGGPRG